jgi:hypothetical protein
MKAIILILLIFQFPKVYSGAFVFSGESNGVDVIAHPQGFTNPTPSSLTVHICIDPSSSVTTELETSVKNIVSTFNHLNPSVPNLIYGSSNNIPSGNLDWESVVLHEVGHCLGLAHPNLGQQTSNGVTGVNTDFTQSTNGIDSVFDFGAGLDGVIGSNDDQRDDDINLHWFNIGINNPFIASPPYDISNYSRDLSDLPNGHSFASNADLNVGVNLGFPNSEAVMQQGSRNDEDQRKLSIDDVATLSLAI